MSDASYNREEIERLFFQMDSLLHSRVNNLLLAETIFFLAAATTWDSRPAVIIIAFLGATATVLFTFTNFKLYFRVTWLIQQFKTTSPFYADYLAMKDLEQSGWRWVSKQVLKVITTENQPRWLDTGWLYTWGLGGICLVGWIALVVTRLVTTSGSASACQ